MANGGSRVFRRDDKVVVAIAGAHADDEARALSGEVRICVERGAQELVVDLRELTTYTRGARQVWQAELAGIANRLRTLTLVGGTPLARMASAAVCLYAGIKMRSVDDLAQIDAEPPS